MGVHLTFVRSIDLDEWTQRQIDAMIIGGNGAARAYFRKHGMALEANGGNGAEKKYKSKVAQSYRTELAKLVEAEARKRGEGMEPASSGDPGVNEDPTDVATALLQNLDVGDQKSLEEEAKQRLAAARAAANQDAAKPTLKPVASMPGAKGKLVVGSTLQKPGTLSSSAMLLKRKPSSGVGASKLRVNKFGSFGEASSSENGDDTFQDIEETQRAAAEAEKERAQLKADEALARKLQEELSNGTTALAVYVNGNSSASTSTFSSNGTQSSTRTAQPSAATDSNGAAKVSKMDENMARLKALNIDFFSDL